MPRFPRIEFAGTCCHAMLRGNTRLPVRRKDAGKGLLRARAMHVAGLVRVAMAALGAAAIAGEGFAASNGLPVPGRPVAEITFDALGPKPTPAPRLASGRSGHAAQVADTGLVYELPPGFSAESGTVEMWIRPGYNCADSAYHRFFDLQGESSKAKVFLYKSGDGGKNGLFMVVYDEDGDRSEAMAVVGRDYAWEAGDWHHLAGSWDGAAGMIKLFLDGHEIASRTGTPFTVGPIKPVFGIGGTVSGANPARGLIDDVRLFQEAFGFEPLVRTGRGAPDTNPWAMLDGDTGDRSSWTGRGTPNSVEIQLPKPLELARVIVHPGNRLYAPNPSTECSPRTFVVQGWIEPGLGRRKGIIGRLGQLFGKRPERTAEWRDLTGVIDVPRYSGGPGEFSVAAEFAPCTLRKFRIKLLSTHDGGKRVSSPTTPIVAPEDRSVVIRELQWRSAGEVAATRAKAEQARARVAAGIAAWQQRFAATPDPIGSAVRQLYGEALACLKRDLKALPDHDDAGLDSILQRWEHTERWLAPWRGCELRKAEPPAEPDTVCELRTTVDAGETPHEFYPAKVALDLRIVEAAVGQTVDPYTIDVLDLTGATPSRCNSRFDRITPDKGTLTWTLRNRTHTRFAFRFRPRPDAPPELGRCTLGDGDHFYFDEVQNTSLPHDMWSCVFLDWDNDGRQDAIAGSWNDFCHLWRNVGTAREPAFAAREHFLIMDDTETPLAMRPEHPACSFSTVMPIDFDGDGRVDLFMDRYFAGAPVFHRNLGPASFPIMSRGERSVGLSRGKVAFGDLTGDGIADAVVVIHANDRDTLRFHAGRELGPNSVPVFEAGQDLDTEVVRSFDGGRSSRRTTLALADTDADGDLDLYVVGAPHVREHRNDGTATAFSFATKGRRVEYRGKPLDVGFYYPSISWSDYDADGDLDLIKLTGGAIYRNDGSPKQVRLAACHRAPVSRQKVMGRSNLKCQAMLDWDGDGDLDHLLPHSRCLDVTVTAWQDGLFRGVSTVEVDPNKKDWYGCPDTTEYEALYALLSPFDWDGDGDMDLFFNSEHAWRFGYLHYYENLGNSRFATEVEWRPGGGTCDHVPFVDGKQGKAARIDANTFLDYLSYRTAGCFDASGGTVRFWFRPRWEARTPGARYFFHTAPTPAVGGVRAEPLRRHYTGQLPGLEIPPPFALFATARGTLRLQAGQRAVESDALAWQDGAWHRIEASWGRNGLQLSFDGTVVAATDAAVAAVPCGRRMHIGSHAWMGVQRQREYPSRWHAHPTDFSQPAEGDVDEFEILDAHGDSLFALPFDGHADSAQGDVGSRLRVGYRCTPGFADLTGDGRPDMVMMLSDGRRGRGSKPEHRSWGEGKLFLFPGTGPGPDATPGCARPVLLTHENGDAFRCHIRTKVTPVDWDRDGLIDLIASTEDHGGAKINRAVDLFRNVGTRTRPVFAARRPMTRLNRMLNAQHDVKVNAVDLTGNGRLDLVTSTDPGTCVFYRSFLDEAPAKVAFDTLKR